MELRSVLGRRDVLALAFGAMVGWGWVVLSGDLIRLGGTLGSMAAFVVGACLVGFVGLAYAELTSAMPRAGGELTFTYRALGPVWSWLCGWSLILAYVGVCAFESVAIATVFNYLVPAFQFGGLYEVAGSTVSLFSILIGIGGGVFVAVINWYGIKTSALLQWLATGGLLLVGVSFFVGSNLFGSSTNLTPHFTGLEGILRVAMLTPFLMIGFDIIPQAAEEIRISRREIGKIILISIAMATTWYILVQWGVGLALSAQEIEGSLLPTADAAARVFGTHLAAQLLVLGGLLGIVTSWNAFFVGATRLVFSMARAQMLPAPLARLHPRHQTPMFAVLFITGCSLVAPFLGRQALVWLANASSLAAVVAFFLVSVSFIQLRRWEPEMPRPYRVRNGWLVGWCAVLVSLGFFILYLPPSPSALLWPQEWALIVGWAALGFIAYFIRMGFGGSVDRARQEQILLGKYARTPEP